MKLIVDFANLDQIKELYAYYPIDGVTTNPSIIAKEGKNPYAVLKKIREFIGAEAELHVQVISSAAEGMLPYACLVQWILNKVRTRAQNVQGSLLYF